MVDLRACQSRCRGDVLLQGVRSLQADDARKRGGVRKENRGSCQESVGRDVCKLA